MSTAIIPLPEIQVESTSGKDRTVAHLRPSLELTAPAAGLRLETYEQLLTAVREEYVWIMRNGACYLEISLVLSNHSLDRFNLIEELGKDIENFQIWDRLGVRLQRCTSGLCSGGNTIRFSIQHPNLDSVLLAPSNAVKATLVSLRCCIELSTTTGDDKVRSRRPSKRRKQDQQPRTSGMKTLVIDDDTGDGDLFQHLGELDQKAIDDFVVTVTQPIIHNSWRGQNPLSKHRPAAVSGQDVVRWLEIVLELVMIGGRRLPAGFKLMSAPIPSASLSAVMPGVINVTHLEALASRARHIPIMAQSLARFQNAESPSLRRKVQSLGGDSTKYSGTTKVHDGNRTVEDIERRIWELTISNMKQLPLKGPSQSNRHWSSSSGQWPSASQFNWGAQPDSKESFGGEWATPHDPQTLSVKDLFPDLDENMIQDLEFSGHEEECFQSQQASSHPLWLDESI